MKLFKEIHRNKLLLSSLVILFTFFTVFMAFQIKNLKTSYSLSDFFPKNHSFLNKHNEISRTFNLQDKSYLYFTLSKHKDNWINKKDLTKLARLGDEIKQNSAVKNFHSLLTIESAQLTNKDLYIGPLIDIDSGEKVITENVRKNSLVYGQLISKDLKTILIAIELNNLSQTKLNQFVALTEKKIKSTYPNFSVQTGGVPQIQAKFISALNHDLKFILIMCFVVFSFIFFSFFKDLSSTIFFIFGLISVNTLALGALAILNKPFTALLSVLPIIVSVTFISMILHTFHRWNQTLSTNSKVSFIHVVETFKEMLLGNFLGCFTTSIGFAALTFTTIPLIKEFAIVIASCVLLVFVYTQILFLCFMYFLKPQLRSIFKNRAYFMTSFFRHKSLIVFGSLFLLLSLPYFLFQLNFSSRLFDDLNASNSARKSTELIDKKFGGLVTMELELESKVKNFWSQKYNLTKLNTLVDKITAVENVGSASSVANLIFDPKKNQQQINETLFLFSMNENNPINYYMNSTAEKIRISVRFYDQPNKKINKSKNEILKLAKSEFSDLRINTGGLGLTSHYINSDVSKELVLNFWHPIVLISLFLIFFFRSFILPALAAIPNLIPPTLLIALMALNQTPLKPGVAIIFSIALGLAFNNTVYILSRFNNYYKKNNPKSAAQRAIIDEGFPCLFETIIMFFGFSIFIFSNFEANQIFGVYMLSSIIGGALADLVLLPVLLNIYATYKLNKRPELQVQLKPQDVTYYLKQASSFFIIIFIGLAFSSDLQAAGKIQKDAKILLEKVASQLKSNDEESTVELTIIERNGEKKKRRIDIQLLTASKFYSIARVLSPADVKGTAILSIIDNKSENQWLYLPSSKQVRKIVTNKKSSAVLGSELSMEDLNPTLIKNSEVTIKSKNADSINLKLRPMIKNSIFDEVNILVDLKTNLPKQTNYLSKGKVVKTVQFLNYKKLDSKVFRAQKIDIKNLKKGRGTTLTFTNHRVNTGLNEEDFSVNELKSSH